MTSNVENGNMLTKVVQYYVSNNVKRNAETVDQEAITQAVRENIVKDAYDELVAEGKGQVVEEVKQYKRNLLEKLKRTVILETIIIALLVGLVVNQITNLIPVGPLWVLGVCLASVVVGVAMVYLATSDTKE